MSLPIFPTKSQTERTGIHILGAIISKMGLIFRETSNSDTGIDGTIEEVNDENEATGRFLAVQVKAGESYFHDEGDHFVFYSDEKHIDYWKLYPMPVILCLFKPDENNVYYQSISKHSDVHTHIIQIPKNQILSLSQDNNVEDLFACIGGSCSEYHSTPELYKIMNENKIQAGESYVSFMDLFVGSLTNLCADLFIDYSVMTNLLDLRTKQPVFQHGELEKEFFWSFIKFVTKENLASVNFDACLYDWNERSLTPRIIASLTYRGRDYRDYVESKHPGSVSEAYVTIQIDYYWDERMNLLLLE